MTGGCVIDGGIDINKLVKDATSMFTLPRRKPETTGADVGVRKGSVPYGTGVSADYRIGVQGDH